MENAIEIAPAQIDVEPATLTGRNIHIHNDGERSAVYRILGARQLENGNLLLDIGDVSPIRQYRDKFDPAKGFIYDMEKGQSFRIPLSYTV